MARNLSLKHAIRSFYGLSAACKVMPPPSLQSVNPYLQGQRLDNVVAKKSVPHFSEEEEEEAPTSSAAIKPTNWPACTPQIKF